MASMQQNPWLRNHPDENVEKEEEELLVFGYSCKLFRDDEKALYIDQGRHLIPWMGDDGLMIDRYDARGYLHDLKKYEFNPMGNAEEVFSEDERRIEELCEEERYMFLYKDMTEEEMYHEEELKRLRAALGSDGEYHEIGFNYENFKEVQSTSSNASPAKEDSEDEPYHVPDGLTIPAGMILPSTMKIHTIIEKTALFISHHGPQMEIVIKTKQSSNPQFNFLSFDSPLNGYYKYLIKSIKSGKYHPKPPKKDDDGDDSDANSDDDSHYLHPSLLGGKAKPEPDGPLLLPFIPFRREDDAYSRLVQSLKDKIVDSNSANSSPMPYQTSVASVAEDDQEFYDSSHHSYYQHHFPHMPCGSSMPPPPGVEPVMLPYLEQPPPPGEERTAFSFHSGNRSSLLFNPTSGSHTVNSDIMCQNVGVNMHNVVPPPPDLQPIIDKMAEYVAKNGDDFEIIVKSKNDKRFEFLEEGNKFHRYYMFKKQMHLNEKSSAPSEPGQGTESKVGEDKENKILKNTSCSKIPKAPVSFSIRPKDVEHSAIEKKKPKKAIILGGSESEGEEDTNETDVEGNGDDIRKKADPPPVNTDAEESSNSFWSNEKVKKPTPQEIEAKLAEERIKDKLVAAARERLASQSREKQLQMERKKKATLFLNMIKKSSSGRAESTGDKAGSISSETKNNQCALATQSSSSNALSPSCRFRSSSDASPLLSEPRSPQSEMCESQKIASNDVEKMSEEKEMNIGMKALLNLHSSCKKQRETSPKHRSKHKSYDRSRSRSPSKSHYSSHRSDSHDRSHRRHHHHSSHHRSRSRSRSRSGSFVSHSEQHRSSSPSFSRQWSSGFDSKRHRTPPAAYALARRSHSRSPSPRRHRWR